MEFLREDCEVKEQVFNTEVETLQVMLYETRTYPQLQSMGYAVKVLRTHPAWSADAGNGRDGRNFRKGILNIFLYIKNKYKTCFVQEIFKCL